MLEKSGGSAYTATRGYEVVIAYAITPTTQGKNKQRPLNEVIDYSYDIVTQFIVKGVR